MPASANWFPKFPRRKATSPISPLPYTRPPKVDPKYAVEQAGSFHTDPRFVRVHADEWARHERIASEAAERAAALEEELAAYREATVAGYETARHCMDQVVQEAHQSWESRLRQVVAEKFELSRRLRSVEACLQAKTEEYDDIRRLLWFFAQKPKRTRRKKA